MEYYMEYERILNHAVPIVHTVTHTQYECTDSDNTDWVEKMPAHTKMLQQYPWILNEIIKHWKMTKEINNKMECYIQFAHPTAGGAAAVLL